jgi:hypothetical protein
VPDPSVKDAVEVVTDPANVDAFSDTHSDYRKVNSKRAVSALRALGAGKGTAQTLISDAVRELDGRVEAEVVASGRAVGPDSSKAAYVWYVPVAKIRED